MSREDMLMGQLEALLDKKNTMSESEFRKYEILFKKPSNMPTLDISSKDYDSDKANDFVDSRQALSIEWNNRVNIQKPVRIVDNVTHEEIASIPPALSEVKSLNEIDGIDAENVINALNNSHDRSTRERNLVPEQVAKVKVILQHARSEEETSKIVGDFAEMADGVLSETATVNKTTDTIDVSSSMGDAEWE